jgi:hypothetical protein
MDGIDALVAANNPPWFASPVSGQVGRAMSYLQSIHPGNDASPAKKTAYVDQVKAVLDPESAIQGALDNKVSAAQVAAMQAVYPEALGQIREIISAAIKQRQLADPKYRPENGIRILAGKMYNPAIVLRLQQTYADRRAERQQQQAQRAVRGVAEAAETQSERASTAW